MTERKATEILASLEAEVKKLSKSIGNQNFQLSLILNKLNEQENAAPPVQQTTNQQPKQQATMPGFKPGVKIMDGVLVSSEKTTDVEEFNFTDADTLARPIPVVHKVHYPDGSAVFNATIDVYNSNGEKIKTLKTNNGKWTSQLNPGNYTINIFKASTNVKPEIKTSLNITVPNSHDVVDLGIYKGKFD